MAEDNKCGVQQLHEYQLTEIKETQKGILETQDEFNIRIKVLEENKIEMKMEFQNLKQSQIEQKALMLDLDRSSREKTEKLFDKVLTSQDTILTKVLESQNTDNKNRSDLSKKKLAMFGTVIAAIVSIVSIVAEKLFK